MFQWYSVLVLAPVFGLITNVSSHVVMSRLNKGRNQMVCLFGGFAAGLICALFLVFSVHHEIVSNVDFLAYLAAGFIAYSALAYGYFHFVNINIASLRIRILHEICYAREGLSEENILSCYNAEQTIDNRIQRLVNSRQLMKKNERYFLGENPIFLILFWIFELMKYAILGRGNRLLKAAGHETRIGANLIQLFWENQFCRFLFIGGINTIFGYSAYAFLVLSGVDYRAALTISTILAVLFNFYTNGRFVFRNKSKIILVKFILLNGFAYFLNQGLLICLVSLGIGKLVSQAVILPFVVIVLFVTNKTWVFRRSVKVRQEK